MSPSSSPVRRRRPHRPPRDSRGRNRPRQRAAISTLTRSVLVVAVMWSIASGTYFAYLLGRQQITYERLRAQVDRVVQLFDQKQVEQQLTALQQRQAALEQHASEFTVLQQRQATLEQHASALTDLLTTGSIKPERIASPEATPPEKPTLPINAIVFAPPERIAPPEAPAEKPTPASPIDNTVVAPPVREASLQSRELVSATTKHQQIHRAAHQRAPRRHGVGAPLSAAGSIAPPGAKPAEQSRQLTSATTKPEAGISDQ
jgi:hypothetical protein